MTTGAELGEYFMQTHIQKIPKIDGTGFNPLTPLWVRDWGQCYIRVKFLVN